MDPAVAIAIALALDDFRPAKQGPSRPVPPPPAVIEIAALPGYTEGAAVAARTKSYLVLGVQCDPPLGDWVQARTEKWSWGHGAFLVIAKPDDGGWLVHIGDLPATANAVEVGKLVDSHIAKAKEATATAAAAVQFDFASIDATDLKPWSLSASRKGKLVLVDVWGSWCGPCVKTLPLIVGLHQQHAANGLEVVGIGVEAGNDPQLVVRAAGKHKLPYRQLVGDSKLLDRLNANRMPTIILFDNSGREIWRHVGQLDSSSLAALNAFILKGL